MSSFLLIHVLEQNLHSKRILAQLCYLSATDTVKSNKFLIRLLHSKDVSYGIFCIYQSKKCCLISLVPHLSQTQTYNFQSICLKT